MLARLLCALLLPIYTHAATEIIVAGKFADVPSGTEVPATAEKLDKLKGVEVLSAPTVLTSPGRVATIEITQDAMVPGAKAVPLGFSLSITPTLGEKLIAFTGKATDRASHGKRSDGGVNVVEFATREIYFEGSVANGGTVVLHSAPVSSKGTDGKTKSRELVVYLTFTKKVTEEAPVKKPVTKSGTTTLKKTPAPTKTTTKKPTTTSTKKKR